MHHALSLAPLTLVAVLIFSSIAKFPDPGSTHSMMTLLRLPRLVANRPVARLLPFGELAVAALLLTPWRATYALGAVAAVALFAAFWVVIARAMTFDPRPTCGCFGRVGDHRVNSKTVARNTVLLGLALVSAWIAWRGGSATSLVSRYDTNDWLWLLLAAVLAAVTFFILGGAPTGPSRKERRAYERAHAEQTATAPTGDAEESQEELDYVRRPIPDGILVDRQHQVTRLPALAQQQAQLLVLANCWCGPTMESLRRLPGWRERLPQLGVQMIFTLHPFDVAEVGAATGVWWDPDSQLWRALEIQGSPAAVLLGADGLLAGGPVSGLDAIEEFVDDIAEQLGEAATAQQG